MVDIRRYEGFAEIPIEHYDGLLIDLDDTLYSYERCHQIGLDAAFEACGMGLDASAFAKRYRAARDAVTARLEGQGACRSRLFAFQAMAEAHGLRQPYVAALELDQAYWNAFLAAMRPDPEAREFLTRCRRQGLSVAVVTDMTAEVQIRKLRQLGLVDLVEHLVTSEETGREKPHRSMFETALRKLDIRAERAVMVGDQLVKDIEGAAALGIHGALVVLKDIAA
ncbi:haloacid dehalogenase [Aureimonas endophytica]|uniref:Haloacid dehalogenase n=1 Tax=Aureimonas endophytica TaxID=2027858 RepID=A0A917A4C0_9HYPH|nr:HAD family hydrolase [Aureimonas endophytica]GGE24455.1 haloacid dehalogenase [Aureimonas endophytica]